MKIRYWYLWKGGEDLTGSAPYAAIFELYILVRERFRATTRMGCNDTRTIMAGLDSMCERCGSHHLKESEYPYNVSALRSSYQHHAIAHI
jgi:hypothetical protein